MSIEKEAKELVYLTSLESPFTRCFLVSCPSGICYASENRKGLGGGVRYTMLCFEGGAG